MNTIKLINVMDWNDCITVGIGLVEFFNKDNEYDVLKVSKADITKFVMEGEEGTALVLDSTRGIVLPYLEARDIAKEWL